MIAENGLDEEREYPDSTSPPTILRRRVEDDYRVDWARPLGATRNVVRCQHRKTQQACVLKFMPKSDVSLHEIYMLHYCTTHCPDKVTRLLAAYENDVYFGDNPGKAVRYHLVVLEYVNGGTLFHHVQRLGFKYTERTLSKLFRQLVSCLHSLHNLNIAHRDIKPENVLVSIREDSDDDEPALKLTDLAFAHFDRGHSLASECGTPEYQAPETQIDHPRVSRRGGFYNKSCDIWSLGVTLYVLLSGVFPFQGQRVQAKLIQDYTFPEEAWHDVSMRGQAFVQTMLCAPPRLRPAAGQLLDHPYLCDPDTLNNNYLSAAERLAALPEKDSVRRDEAEVDVTTLDGSVLESDVDEDDEDGNDDGVSGDNGGGGVQRGADQGGKTRKQRRTLHRPKAPFVTMAASSQNQGRQTSQDRLSLPTSSQAPQKEGASFVGPGQTNSHNIDAKLVDTCDFWESPVTTASVE